MPSALIGIDWGTSSFRAFLMDAGGNVLDRRFGPHGILSVANGDFASVLKSQVSDWLQTRTTPIVMSGMIGSRQGWVEAPYITCPATLSDVSQALVHVPFAGARTWIVPGVQFDAPSMRDLMRGEETQIFGALAASGEKSGRFLLPGTHSKWVTVRDGSIVAFATYMTGEIYAACKEHTILGRLMQPGENPAAFVRGVAEGARKGSPGALLSRVFGVRTSGLSGAMGPTALADYLSGLLIGAEVADAAPRSGETVHIIASEALAERYHRALDQRGIKSILFSPDVVAAGHMQIARAAGLISAKDQA